MKQMNKEERRKMWISGILFTLVMILAMTGEFIFELIWGVK